MEPRRQPGEPGAAEAAPEPALDGRPAPEEPRTPRTAAALFDFGELDSLEEAPGQAELAAQGPGTAEADSITVLGAVAPVEDIDLLDSLPDSQGPLLGRSKPSNSYIVEYVQVPIRDAPKHEAIEIATLWRGQVVVCEASVLERGEEWLVVQISTASQSPEPSSAGAARLPDGSDLDAQLGPRVGYVPRQHRLFGRLLRCLEEPTAEVVSTSGATEEQAGSAAGQPLTRSRLRPGAPRGEREILPEQPLDGSGAALGCVEEAQCAAALCTAATWLASADAIIVASGVGMGSDSNFLASWRQQLAMHGPGVSFEAACSGSLFNTDPQLAWGFWSQRCQQYREARPHKGYRTVSSWASQAPLGGFSVTSHVDGHWMMSGWPADRILELHGTVHWLQCVVPCCDEVWAAEKDFALSVDPATHRVVGDVPRCPTCGKAARPCLRVHRDDRGFVQSILKGQQQRFSHWSGPLLPRPGAGPLERSVSSVVLELGCGPGSEQRSRLEPLLGPRCRLVRVHPRNASAKAALEGSAVSLPLEAPDALARLARLWAEQETVSFLCLDAEGNGAEVAAPASACAGHVYRRALAALAREGAPAEVEPDGPSFAARHVHQSHRAKSLQPGECVPPELFFARAGEGGDERPVTWITVTGVCFHKRNAALQLRVGRVMDLVSDLIKAFEKPEYQRSISHAQDAKTIQEFIRSVHVQVLPRHGFPVARAGPSRVFELQLQMQGFIQSGCVTPEILEYSTRPFALSGFDKAQELTTLRQRHAKARAEAVKAAKGKPTAPPSADKVLPSCVVLMRHGQREDYLALAEGRGAEWVSQTERPWDPPLAEVGHLQAKAAAARLREVLTALGLPFPSVIYSSPLIRCVETGDVMAKEFAVRSLLVEEGLMEAICEAWMRQWAVPGANANWGGPPHAPMPEAATHRYEPTVQGPEVLQGLRPEAEHGLRALLRTAPELAALGGAAARVAPRHESAVWLRQAHYRWGQFETQASVVARVLETVTARAAEHPGRTLLFVSHGGPTQFGFEALARQPVPAGSGGMCSLSVLQRRPEASGLWEPLLANDARHAKPMHRGAGR